MNSGPLIIAGMHRSGTSWITSLLENLGLSIGSNCIDADRNNKKGYFEDINFLTLNRKILNSSLTAKEQSYTDWGWSSSECLDPENLVKFEAEAIELLNSRKNTTSLWGWKDPRNTVLLDFWKKLCPQAKYILVYRYPWEVADSMQRLAAEVFLKNPDYAIKIWEFYNRQILNFYHQNKNNCLLLSSNALSLQQDRFRHLICNKFGIIQNSICKSNQFSSALFKSFLIPEIAAEIYSIAFPSAVKLLEELDSAADLPNSMHYSGASSLRFNRSWSKNNLKPKVSVIIPCFNQGIFLPEALASVECYAPSETEVLITNDGSTDPETIKILNNFSESGYKIINQSNAGLATTRNRMSELALADIILPLDADNRICPGFIDRGLEILLSDDNISIVYGERIDFGLRNEICKVPDFNLKRIMHVNYIDACALIRRDLILDCGGYDSNIKALEDWELWINAASRGYNFYKLPLNAFEYRVRPLSMVTILENPQIQNEIISYIHNKHWKLYLPWLKENFKEKISELQSANEEINKLQTINKQSLSFIEDQRKLLLAQKLEIEQLKNMLKSDQEIIQSQNYQIDRLNHLAFKMQNSKSWQITAPLRSVMAKVRNKFQETK